VYVPDPGMSGARRARARRVLIGQLKRADSGVEVASGVVDAAAGGAAEVPGDLQNGICRRHAYGEGEYR